MTAEIAIMNKHAIALAADSAITSGEKIFQSANKIFALSKNHPVGIMIYSTASYCGIPWETIIKLYRKTYPNICFRKLHFYVLHFFRFLKYNKIIQKNKLSDNSIIKDFSENFSLEIIKDIKDVAKNLFYNNDKIKKDKLNYTIRVSLIHKFLDIRKLEASKLRIKIPYSHFKYKFQDIINAIYGDYELNKYEEFIPLFKKLFLRCIYLLFTCKYFQNPYSGVVFTGFGEEEIYPRLESYIIGLCIMHHTQVLKINDIYISDSNSATVTPFAQGDIISLFMSGIHPGMSNELNNMYLSILNEHFKLIIDLLKVKKKKLSIDYITINKEIVNKINEKMKRMEEDFWVPTINTISIMQPIEIARLADSLVSITSVHRKVSLSLETVGGPTDVALISKGDGFIWIIRQHYFDPALNLDYINRNHKGI